MVAPSSAAETQGKFMVLAPTIASLAAMEDFGDASLLFKIITLFVSQSVA